MLNSKLKLLCVRNLTLDSQTQNRITMPQNTDLFTRWKPQHVLSGTRSINQSNKQPVYLYSLRNVKTCGIMRWTTSIKVVHYIISQYIHVSMQAEQVIELNSGGIALHFVWPKHLPTEKDPTPVSHSAILGAWFPCGGRSFVTPDCAQETECCKL